MLSRVPNFYIYRLCINVSSGNFAKSIYIYFIAHISRSRRTRILRVSAYRSSTVSPLVAWCFRFDYWLFSGSHRRIYLPVYNMLTVNGARRRFACTISDLSRVITVLRCSERVLITSASARVPKGAGRIMVVSFICATPINTRARASPSLRKYTPGRKRFSTLLI